MAASKTAVLEARVTALETRLQVLEDFIKARIMRARAAAPVAPTASDFPLTDKRGRRYRQSGNVRTFAPS